MGKIKLKSTENAAELKNIREYYARSTRLFALMAMLFVMVIAGLGIYTADIMSADDANETKVFCLYTVFIIGGILTILLFIAFIMGRRDGRGCEAALKLRRLLAVIACAIGILSTGVSIAVIAQTYGEWEDGYTKAIFIIQLAGGILTVILSAALFILSFKGAGFYDGGRPAKDIPESATAENNDRKFLLWLTFSQIILAGAVYFLALYFANEINAYSIQSYSDYDVYEGLYRIIFAAGAAACGLLLTAGILIQVIRRKRIYMLCIAAFMLTGLIELVFTVYSLINAGRGFVKAGHPDLSYIIFGVILVLVSSAMLIVSYITVRPYISEKETATM